jgi:hypothetical protein
MIPGLGMWGREGYEKKIRLMDGEIPTVPWLRFSEQGTDKVQ